MPTFFKYPSIEQFRHTVKAVNKHEEFKNILFSRTVKLHGTNAAIVLDVENNSIHAQSRNRLLSIGDDNAGFAQYVSDNSDDFINMIQAYNHNHVDTNHPPSHIAVYGEWCGESIQRGVALNQLPKMFVVFEVRVIFNGNFDTSTTEYNDIIVKDAFWKPEIKLFNVHGFGSDVVNLDFTDAYQLQQQLLAEAQEVELECPAAKYFDVSGTGEGYVYTSLCGTYKFKVKGEKHSVSGTKVLSQEDVAKQNKVSDFVSEVLLPARLEQGIEYLKEMQYPLEMQSLSHYIKWVITDVNTEEQDSIQEREINVKTLNAQLAKVARQYFQNNI